MKDSYLTIARVNDPAGSECYWCGMDNYFADDIGWFYCAPVSAGTGRTEDDASGATCEACYQGTIGKRHRARWGEGER